jgi:hypothetical protein
MASAYRNLFFLAFCAYGAGNLKSARADEAGADALLRIGVQLRRERRDDEALDMFARANALAPTAVARAQMALAEQALGRWVEAERDLDAALRVPTDPWITRNRDALENTRRELEHHLGWITVETEPSHATVRVDGEVVPQATELRIPAGSRVLDLRAVGYAAEIRHVEVGPEIHVKVAVELRLEPVDPPIAAAPIQPVVEVVRATDRASGRPVALRAGPLALGAAGITVAGVGAYFGLLTIRDKGLRDGQCVGGVCARPARDYDSDARRSAALSTLAFGAGLSAVAAAGMWWWLDSKRSREGEPGVVAIPLGPSGVSVFFNGKF